MNVHHPVVHLVGSVPLPDSESVFRTVCGAVGSYITRLPDGETGIRKSWIKFLQDVLADHPAIELDPDAPPFKFVQWDGVVVREIPRLHVIPGKEVTADGFVTGYADMAIESFAVFDRLQAIDQQLSPDNSGRWIIHSYLSGMHLSNGDFDQALAEARRARQIQPTFWTGLDAALALVQLGRTEEAVEAVAPMRRDWPQFDLRHHVKTMQLKCGDSDHARLLQRYFLDLADALEDTDSE